MKKLSFGLLRLPKKADGKTLDLDAAIAMLSVGALAVGYLLLNLFSAAANVAFVKAEGYATCR